MNPAILVKLAFGLVAGFLVCIVLAIVVEFVVQKLKERDETDELLAEMDLLTEEQRLMVRMGEGCPSIPQGDPSIPQDARLGR